MIFELIVKVLAGLVKFIATLFGAIPLPGWWENVGGWASSLASTASGMSSWVPWTMILGAVGFVFLCATVAFTIRLVRIVLSLFTGGGGSAA